MAQGYNGGRIERVRRSGRRTLHARSPHLACRHCRWRSWRLVGLPRQGHTPVGAPGRSALDNGSMAQGQALESRPPRSGADRTLAPLGRRSSVAPALLALRSGVARVALEVPLGRLSVAAPSTAALVVVRGGSCRRDRPLPNHCRRFRRNGTRLVHLPASAGREPRRTRRWHQAARRVLISAVARCGCRSANCPPLNVFGADLLLVSDGAFCTLGWIRPVIAGPHQLGREPLLPVNAWTSGHRFRNDEVSSWKTQGRDAPVGARRDSLAIPTCRHLPSSCRRSRMKGVM